VPKDNDNEKEMYFDTKIILLPSNELKSTDDITNFSDFINHKIDLLQDKGYEFHEAKENYILFFKETEE